VQDFGEVGYLGMMDLVEKVRFSRVIIHCNIFLGGRKKKKRSFNVSFLGLFL
jgi:hypothetical protein